MSFFSVESLKYNSKLALKDFRDNSVDTIAKAKRPNLRSVNKLIHFNRNTSIVYTILIDLIAVCWVECRTHCSVSMAEKSSFMVEKEVIPLLLFHLQHIFSPEMIIYYLNQQISRAHQSKYFRGSEHRKNRREKKRREEKVNTPTLPPVRDCWTWILR